MKCPKKIHLCPEGWENCPNCRYVSHTNTCLYPKSDIDIVVLAAKISEEVVTAEAIESAQKIRGTWMEELDQVTGIDEFWTWFSNVKRPGDINYKEPLKAGPSETGGGSKSRVPPKPPYKMPEYLKNWGQAD